MKITSSISYEDAKKDFEESLEFYGRTPAHTLYGSLNDAKMHYAKAHPALFSNENNGYLKAEGIPNGASAFTIAASYDTALDLIGLGARDIYSIDINSKQFFIDCLKIWSAYYLTFDEFYWFLIYPLSDRFLSDKTMDYILSKVPESPARMYWYLIYNKGGRDLLQEWVLLDECNFKNHHSTRVTHYLYAKSKEFYEKVREGLESAYFRFETEDFVNIDKLNLPENIFDCALLSNIHNFLEPSEFYKIVVEKIIPLLKTSGWLSYYEIERKPEWFSTIKKGNFPNITENDFLGNPENGGYQLLLSLELYKMFVSGGFDSTIYSLSTGGGFKRIKTDRDCAIIIHK